jgi:isocitrate/isopropylmalate dehydrogenase
MIIDYMSYHPPPERNPNSIAHTIRDAKTVTTEIGGTATTDPFTDAIIARL